MAETGRLPITYFANPCRVAVPAMLTRPDLAMIVTPKQGNRLPPGVIWCADNGCGPGKNGVGAGYPGDEGYLAFLAGLADRQGDCLFATAPDVVGDAAATLARSRPMFAKIRAAGYAVALVAQEGLDQLDVPWDEFDWLFIGGGQECRPCSWQVPLDWPRVKNQPVRCPACGARVTEWKMGPEAAGLVAEAGRRGKLVHFGRVNSFTRLAYAQEIGCDTADGTYLTFGPGKNLPKLLSWLDRVNGSPAPVRTRASFDLAALPLVTGG